MGKHEVRSINVIEIECPYCGLSSHKILDPGEHGFRCISSEGGCGKRFLMELKIKPEITYYKLQEVESDGRF